MSEDYFEECITAEQVWEIIAIFLDKLDEKDPSHVEDLFNYLFTVSGSEIKKFCRMLTISQKLNFFRERTNFFIVRENYICKNKISDIKKKFSSIARFILQCFDTVHYFEVKKLASFIFEDVAYHMSRLSLEKEKKLMENLHKVNIDSSGMLTLSTSQKVGIKFISPEEKCLLAIMFHLNLHGRTHFKIMFKKLESFSKKEFDLVFGTLSESDRLAWLKKYKGFQVCENGYLELYEKYTFKCNYVELFRKQFSETNEASCFNGDVSMHVSTSLRINITDTQLLTAENNDLNILESNSIVKKFNGSVAFLLNCFDPLHYLEIKECIFFVMKDVAEFFKKFPVAMLEEFFCKVPFVSMNKNGFLQLAGIYELQVGVITEKELITLFFIYYLGICGKTHFAKIIQELELRAPETLSCTLSKLSVPEKIKYLIQFSPYFEISKDGAVIANPSFSLPICEYNEDESSKEEEFVKNHIHAFSFDMNSEISKRMICSIAYLLKFFPLELSVSPLRVTLHVLKDVKIYFQDLSASNQISFAKEIFLMFNVDEKNVISAVAKQFEIDCLKKMEMGSLYFAYLLTISGKMHYRQAIKSYSEQNGCKPNNMWTDSHEFWYFKKAGSIFNIDNNGYVTVLPLPIIKFSSNTLQDFWKHNKLTLNMTECQPSNHFECLNISTKEQKEIKIENNNGIASCKSIDKYSIAETEINENVFHGLDITKCNKKPSYSLKSESVLNNIPCIVNSDNSQNPSGVTIEQNTASSKSLRLNKQQFQYVCNKNYKMLCEAATSLLSSFGSLHFLNFKKIISLVFDDIRTFLEELPPEEHEELFKNIPLTKMDGNGYLRLKSNRQPEPIISKNKNILLFFVGYIAIKGKTHYSSLIEELTIHSCFDKLSPNQQYNFFRKKNKYFEIDRSGFVTLPASSLITLLNKDDLYQSKANKKMHLSVSVEHLTVSVDSCSAKTNSYITQNKSTELKNDLCSRIQDAISYLLKHFILKATSEFLEVLLLVFDYDDIFPSLSDSDKTTLLRKGLLPFKIDEKAIITLISSEKLQTPGLLDVEKEELLMAFIIFQQKRMHFEKVFQEFKKYCLVLPLNTAEISLKFRYFKERRGLFQISNDGYVTLINWSCIQIDSNIVSQCLQFVASIDSSKEVENKKDIKKEMENSCNVSVNSSKTSGLSDVSDKCQNKSTELKNKLCSRIQDGILYLLKHFNLKATFEFLELLLHLFDYDDIFPSSSDSEKIAVLRKSFLLFKVDEKASITLISSEKFEKSCLLDTEKDLILMAFIIFQQKKMHFENVFQEFKKYNLALPDNTAESSLKFQYFKAKHHVFQISNDGYVTLINCHCSNMDSNIMLQCFQFVTGINCVKEIENKKDVKDDVLKNNTYSSNFTKLFSNMTESETVCRNIVNSQQVSNEDKSITPGNSIKNCLDEGFNVPSDEVKLSDVVEKKIDNIKRKILKPNYMFNSSKAITQNAHEIFSEVKYGKDIFNDSKGIGEFYSNHFVPSVTWFNTKNQSIHTKTTCPNDSKSNMLLNTFSFTSNEIKTSKVSQSEFSEISDLHVPTQDKNLLISSREEFAAQDKFSIDKNVAKDKDCGQSVKQNIDSTNILKPVEKREIFAEDELVENKIKKETSKFVENFLVPCKEWFSFPNNEVKESSESTIKLNTSSPISSKRQPSFSFNKSKKPTDEQILDIFDFLKKYSSLPNNAYEIVTGIISGIVFLFQYFDFNVDCSVVSVVLHVMNDIKYKFLSLSENYQKNILQNIFSHFATLHNNSTNVVKLHLGQYNLIEEFENLLFLVYLLKDEGKFYYHDLFKKFQEFHKDLPKAVKQDSDFHTYFSRRDRFFCLEDGCVEIHLTPLLKLESKLSSVIDFKDSKIDQQWCNNRDVSENKSQPCNSMVDVKNDRLLTLNDEETVSENLSQSGCFTNNSKPLLVNKTLLSNDNETNFKSEFKSCGVADLKESSANKSLANLMPLKSLATNDNETIAKDVFQTFNFVPDLKISIVHNSSISNKDAILENKKIHAPVFIDELKSAEDNKLPSLNSKENVFKPCLNIFGLKALDADSITSQKNTEASPENKSLKCKSTGELKALNTMIVPSIIDHKDAMNKNNFQTYNSVTDLTTSTNNIQSIDYTEVLKDESQNNHVLDLKAIKTAKLPSINCQIYKQLKQPNSFSNLKVLNCDKLPLTNDSNESTLDKENQSVVLSDPVEIIIENDLKDSNFIFKGKFASLCKKIQAAVVHLLKFFHLTAEILLLRAIFHILKDSKIFFDLSANEKIDFLRNCFQIFHLDKKGGIYQPLKIELPKLKHEEKILLSISCILNQHTEMHYRKIFQLMKNQMSPIPSDKNQFKYFKEHNSLFSISNQGSVKLHNTPVIELSPSIFCSFFQVEGTFTNVVSGCETSNQSIFQNSESVILTPNSMNKMIKLPSNSSNNNKDQILKLQTDQKENSFVSEKNTHEVSKKVKDSIFFLLKHFKLTSNSHLICVLLHALEDVRIYFVNLQVSDQEYFVKQILSSFYTDNKGMISNVFSSSPQLNLNSDEKDKLFLTYILSQINEMHYQKIFDTYGEYNREKPIQVTTYLDLYNYFSERKTLFSIDVNGFVKLNAQFMVGQNSKILPISGLMNSEVSKFPVLNSASSETRQIIEQLQFPKILSSTCNSYQVENDVLCHSNSFELLRIHIKESLIFLNSQFDDLPHACGVATVIHILKDLQTLNHSDYEKISLMFDINVNLLRNSSATILCQLSEEEKDLMIITCTLIKSGVLHFTKLFQELKKHNRNAWKSLAVVDQHCYIVQRSKYFYMTSQGIVDLNFPNIGAVNLKNFILKNKENETLNPAKESKSDCDTLINSLIANIQIDTNKSALNGKVPNAEIMASSKSLLNFKEQKLSDMSFAQYSNILNPERPSESSKTKLDHRSVNFFAFLLTNLKMAASLEEHLYLASQEVQNHMKFCYGNKIRSFLQIHNIY